MIYFSHPTGNQNVRHALRALENAGLLREFITTIATFPGNRWERLSRLPGCKEFQRRQFDQRIAAKTIQRPWLELGRLAASRLGLQRLVAHETGRFCVDRIYQDLDRYVASRIQISEKHSGRAVYCYEDGALDTFRTAKSAGYKCIYDLPIGYWRAARDIQLEEAEKLPQWAHTMPALIDSADKFARKDEELKLADCILVASSFTAKTLQRTPFELPQPVVIPYGCPEHHAANQNFDFDHGHNAKDKLRVLFVGGLSQRKGLSYLFEAVDHLGSRCQLTLIGRKPAGGCRPLDEALKRHQWIESLPHEQILEQMRQHDIFVFPSLFEGFGLVITEALSQGLPVIATPHTCAPDILSEGYDGFIVPIRNSEAIAEKLELLNCDRDLLATMKSNALKTSRSHTWGHYESGMVTAVKAIIA